MSSKEFAQSFFPSASAFISSSSHAPYFLFHAWNSIFPDDVATLCSLPPTNTYYVHRPCLAIAALIGISFLRAGRRKKSLTTSPSNKKKKLSPGLSPIHKLLLEKLNSSWSISQKAFAKMNIVALIHHCIIPPPSSYHNTYRIRRYIDTTLRALDQIFTCISCIHLTVVAFLMYYLYHTLKHNNEEDNKKGKDVNTNTATRSIYRMKSILIEYLSAVIPISAVLLEYTINDGMMNNIRLCQLWSVVGTMIEMMYLIPLQIAAMCLLPLAIVIVCSFRAPNNNKSNKESVGAFITLLGGCIVAASLPLDSRLCHFVSKHVPSLKDSRFLYDIYQLPTWVFFGCDISFIGLSIWIKALTERCYEYTLKQQKRAKVTTTRASF